MERKIVEDCSQTGLVCHLEIPPTVFLLEIIVETLTKAVTLATLPSAHGPLADGRVRIPPRWPAACRKSQLEGISASGGC